MTKIIVIDPGHGGSDPGAVSNGLQEKVLTLDISKRTKKYLDNNYTGHIVHLTRTTDKYLTLSERARYANNKKADLFVSMHINAGGGTGYETFVYSNVSNTSSTGKMQSTVHAEANKQMKVTDRGKKKANFAVLRETNMPAILPENLFIDRKEDAAKLKDSKFLDKVAKGHAIGIAKTLGLKKKGSTSTSNKTSNTDTSTSNKKQSTSNKTSSKKYTSIVDYLKDNKIDSSLANRKKLATKHGIKNYTGTAAQNAKLLSILQGGKTTANKPKKTQAKGTVHLPASAKTWRTYKLNVQPVAKNSDWSLTPSRYGGLTYDILGRPYPDVVTINTSKGKRNIYVGKGTGAVVK